ncbi:MAG TPA: protein GlxC [Thermohalobaculum sp.]|nr:protein GlxC [Thermohalobaculum sp.]
MKAARSELANTVLDLALLDRRAVNRALQEAESGDFTVLEPGGAHALACGLQHPVGVTIKGHTGYYTAGMNKGARVTVEGNAGTGVAENMMAGTVRVTGDASQSAGATGHGGLLVIEGNTSARCGISMKGIDIVVGGSIGHMSAFMAQAGRLVVLGDAGPDLGDSIYEARLYVRGRVASLGADCIEKELRDEHRDELAELLARAGLAADPAGFRRYGSARQLYHFHIDNLDAY